MSGNNALLTLFWTCTRFIKLGKINYGNIFTCFEVTPHKNVLCQGIFFALVNPFGMAQGAHTNFYHYRPTWDILFYLLKSGLKTRKYRPIFCSYHVALLQKILQWSFFFLYSLKILETLYSLKILETLGMETRGMWKKYRAL